MAELPTAPIKRLIIEGSHGCRVSGPALGLAAEHLSNIAHLLGHNAGQYAVADGRTEVVSQDIAAIGTMALRMRRSKFIEEYFSQRENEETELRSMLQKHIT